MYIRVLIQVYRKGPSRASFIGDSYICAKDPFVKTIDSSEWGWQKG